MLQGQEERSTASTARPALVPPGSGRRKERRRKRGRALSTRCSFVALWVAAAACSWSSSSHHRAPIFLTALAGSAAAFASASESARNDKKEPENHLPFTDVGSRFPNLEREVGDGDDADELQEDRKPQKQQQPQQKWAFIVPHNNPQPWQGDVATAADNVGTSDDLAVGSEASSAVPAGGGSTASETANRHDPDTNPRDDRRLATALDDDVDDRTLLDLFAESAKEYLTTQLIPLSDPECRWDWRSFRCEPACMCHLNMKWGDYHLGRSCRLVPEFLLLDNSTTVCDASSNLVRVLDQPVPKRFLSLVGQTGQILAQKASKAALKIKIVRNLQQDVCDELWETLVRMECANDKQEISPPPPERTLAERLLCGEMPPPSTRRDEGMCPAGRR